MDRNQFDLISIQQARVEDNTLIGYSRVQGNKIYQIRVQYNRRQTVAY